MRLGLWALGLASSVFAVQACGGDNGTGDGGIDGSTSDGTLDVAMQNDANGGNDTGTGSDTGTGNDTGTGGDTGASDGGTGISIWTCGTTTVADCSLCIGHTQPCVYCSDTDASVITGSCVAQGTSCFMGAPMGYGSCRCRTDAGTASGCPEGFQICFPFGMMTGTGVCDTCGSIPETNNLTCENGGKCNAADGGCN